MLTTTPTIDSPLTVNVSFISVDLNIDLKWNNGPSLLLQATQRTRLRGPNISQTGARVFMELLWFVPPHLKLLSWYTKPFFQDSNIKAVGQDATRVWAVSQYTDAFSNYMSYKYTNDATNGSFYLNEIAYGGNQTLGMAHQRQITLEYESRPDISTKYIGGSLVRIGQRLKSISSLVRNNLVHTHLLAFDAAPLTGVSRVVSLTLVDPSGASVRPLQFDWVDGSPAVFEEPLAENTLEYLGADVDILPMDISATGRSDVVLASMVSVGGMSRTRLASHKVSADGQLPSTPDSIFSDLPYHIALFPVDIDGDGATDLVC